MAATASLGPHPSKFGLCGGPVTMRIGGPPLVCKELVEDSTVVKTAAPSGTRAIAQVGVDCYCGGGTVYKHPSLNHTGDRGCDRRIGGNLRRKVDDCALGRPTAAINRYPRFGTVSAGGELNLRRLAGDGSVGGKGFLWGNQAHERCKNRCE